MKPNRVKHILERNLDDDYVILCGRIIMHRGIFLLNGQRKHNYLEWSDSVDCQDCLRKAFEKQATK